MKFYLNNDIADAHYQSQLTVMSGNSVTTNQYAYPTLGTSGRATYTMTLSFIAGSGWSFARCRYQTIAVRVPQKCGDRDRPASAPERGPLPATRNRRGWQSIAPA